MRRKIKGDELAAEIEASPDGFAIIVDADIKSPVSRGFAGSPFVVFVNCWLSDADFSDGYFRFVFCDCDISTCNFDRAVFGCFHFAPYERLREFRNTWWEKSECQDAVPLRNWLHDCSLVETKMTRAAFREATIRHCDFTRADLSAATGVELDECIVDGTRLPLPGSEGLFSSFWEKVMREVHIWYGDSNYKWGALLLAYTGPSFYLLTLLSLAYLLPPAIIVSVLGYWPFDEKSMSEIGVQMQSAPVISLLIGWRGEVTLDVVSRSLVWLYVIARSVQTWMMSTRRQVQFITGRTPGIGTQTFLWAMHRALRIGALYVIPYLVLGYARILFGDVWVPAALLGQQSEW